LPKYGKVRVRNLACVSLKPKASLQICAVEINPPNPDHPIGREHYGIFLNLPVFADLYYLSIYDRFALNSVHRLKYDSAVMVTIWSMAYLVSYYVQSV
jgi:hypothetical protein